MKCPLCKQGTIHAPLTTKEKSQFARLCKKVGLSYRQIQKNNEIQKRRGDTIFNR